MWTLSEEMNRSVRYSSHAASPTSYCREICCKTTNWVRMSWCDRRVDNKEHMVCWLLNVHYRLNFYLFLTGAGDGILNACSIFWCAQLNAEVNSSVYSLVPKPQPTCSMKKNSHVRGMPENEASYSYYLLFTKLLIANEPKAGLLRFGI